MSAEAQLTPMMAQYRRIKSELPKDALLLFRLGDFYEMFFEDAREGAALINLALTARNGVPMCGLPFHAASSYISRLLKAGRKVAICEQTEDARPGKLVNREVTQILSPGTHFDERMLVAERNNFLAAVVSSGKTFGLALIDLTTGDFLTTEVESEAALLTELERLRPAEIVHPMEATALRDLLRGVAATPRRSDVTATPSSRAPGVEATPPPFGDGASPLRPWTVSAYDDWTFAPQTAVFTVREHFKVASLEVASLDGFSMVSDSRIAPPPLARRAARCITSRKISGATSNTSRACRSINAPISSRSTTPRCAISKSSNRNTATPRAQPAFTAH